MSQNLKGVNGSRLAAFSTIYRPSTIVSIFRECLPELQVVWIDPDKLLSESSKEILEKVEIMVIDTDLYLKIYKSLTAIKWVQIPYRGVEGLFKDLPPDWEIPQYMVTRYGGSQATCMAEYVVSQIISWERKLGAFREEQKLHSWSRQRMKSIRFRSLSELTLGIIGAGRIGTEIARCCKCFGMRTLGLGRRSLPQEKRSPHIDEYRSAGELPWILAESDFIVSVLPSTSRTRGFYTKDIFSHCKKKPVFINIGRGDCIEEETLIHSIKQEWLSGAVLDVVNPEPLPKDSKLWDMPEVVITPHISGYIPEPVFVEQMVSNFKEYLAGNAPRYLINWEKQY